MPEQTNCPTVAPSRPIAIPHVHLDSSVPSASVVKERWVDHTAEYDLGVVECVTGGASMTVTLATLDDGSPVGFVVVYVYAPVWKPHPLVKGKPGNPHVAASGVVDDPGAATVTLKTTATYPRGNLRAIGVKDAATWQGWYERKSDDGPGPVPLPGGTGTAGDGNGKPTSSS